MADIDHTQCVTRRQAKQLGLVKYTSGRVCPNGHDSPRYTSTGMCCACLAKHTESKRAEYLKRQREKRAEHRRLNPLPHKNKSARQVAKESGQVSFLGSACKKCGSNVRYSCNSQCVKCTLAVQSDPSRKAYKKSWSDANAEKLSANRKKKYELGSADAIRRAKEWAQNNVDKRRTISKAYKSRRRSQEAGGDATADIHEWERKAQKKCYWCGADCQKNYHVDHYEPLAKGGKHEIANLVIACAGCNLKKNAKDPYKFAGLFGRLF